MQRYSVFLVCAVIVCIFACGGSLWAQGFGLYEQSPCTMGRAGAGVALPCPDASSVFFNPAGLSFDKSQIGVGGAIVGPRGHFKDNTTSQVSNLNNRWYPVPNIYMSKPMAGRAAIGLGLFAPYGLTTDWPVDSQGRYLGYKSLVQALYLQPTLAIKLNRAMSVGFGIDATYLNVELRQRVDLSTQPLPAFPGIPAGSTFALLGVRPGTDFADVKLKGHTWHAGYHLGVLIKPTDKVSFGARFMSGQKVNVDNGEIITTQISVPYSLPFDVPGVAPKGTPLDLLLKSQFAAGGTLSNQTATTVLPLPAQFVVGTAFNVTQKIKLLVDYQFVRWSMFDTLPINGQYLKSVITESYNDSHGVRAGTEIALGAKSVFRAGVDIHGAAAPDQTVTPNLPEGKRQEYAFGYGRQLGDRFRFDAAYMRLVQPSRAGRTTNGGKLVPTAADNNGVYSFGANLVGMSVSMIF